MKGQLCKHGLTLATCAFCREFEPTPARNYMDDVTTKTCTKRGKEKSLDEFGNSAKDKAQQLVDEHWSYIRFLLLTHGSKEEDLGQVEFHYRSAFVHGYKHGLEAKNEGVD